MTELADGKALVTERRAWHLAISSWLLVWLALERFLESPLSWLVGIAVGILLYNGVVALRRKGA